MNIYQRLTRTFGTVSEFYYELVFAKFKVPENAISYGDVSADGRWIVVNWVTLDKKVEIWKMQD